VSGATNGRILNVSSGNLSQSANLTFDGSILDIQGTTRFRNTVGSVASTIDANGYGFVDVRTFALAAGVDLATGTNLTGMGHIAGYAGLLTKVKIQATTNGSSGGFTLVIKKNGTSVFTTNPTVASSTTTVQNFTPTTTAVAENDVFTVDCTSVGTGVQFVTVQLFFLVRNS
jgi:predicted amidohydrolase YtcJ